VLRGVVRSAQGLPVANVYVRVEGAEGYATSSADGRFVLRALPTGQHTVDVRAMGFAPRRVPVRLARRDTARVELTLEAVPVLAGVRVDAKAPRVAEREFDQRRAAAAGAFLGPQELHRFRAGSLNAVFAHFSGLYVSGAPGGRFDVRMRNTLGFCQPNVYLDGTLATVGFLSTLSADELRAVEVYGRASAAPALPGARAPDRPCGSIYVWTRASWDRL
jgi:hypothetical protein